MVLVTLLAIVCWLTIISRSPVLSEPYVEDDLQAWGITVVNLKVDDKTSLSLQTESRIHNNMRDMEQFLLIPGIAYKLHPNVTVGAMYTFFQDFRPRYNLENRTSEEITLHKTFKKFNNLNLAYRARLEQRFIERTGGMSLRLRHRTRAVYPIKDTGWYIVAQNEFFHNMNNLKNGPKQGFDQNRLFGGVGKKVNEKLSLEGGYQMLYSNNPGAAIDQVGHQIFVMVNYDLN